MINNTENKNMTSKDWKFITNFLALSVVLGVVGRIYKESGKIINNKV